MARIIYDLGANNGDDIPYYLLKADLVVAVEANPELANEIRQRFQAEISQGRVVLKALAVTADVGVTETTFYQCDHHVLSTLVDQGDRNNYRTVTVPAQNVVDLIKECGEPYYIKIDLEHYDANILAALFDNDIRPPYISCEAHSENILNLLARVGCYKKFKRVTGGTVQDVYSALAVETISGEQKTIKFPHHAAGPFGEDVRGPWMTYEEFMVNKNTAWNFGWMDIHCAK